MFPPSTSRAPLGTECPYGIKIGCPQPCVETASAELLQHGDTFVPLLARSLVHPASTPDAKEKGARKPSPSHGDGARAPRRAPTGLPQRIFPGKLANAKRVPPGGERGWRLRPAKA